MRKTTVGSAVLASLAALALTLGACAPEPGTATKSPTAATSRPTQTPVTTPTPTGTPAPKPADLPCASGKTVVSVVAHYDDDLLFANPEILKSIQAGDCVRTVYVTAGDSGRDEDYYKGRERGILRAYNILRGTKEVWDDKAITLETGMQITQLTPTDEADSKRISVTFLRLPDGNINNAGFEATGHQTITNLEKGDLASITQLGTRKSVTRDELLRSIEELITSFHATSLITLVPRDSEWSESDHPDHSTVGTLTQQAWKELKFTGPVHYAVGYHTTKMAANLDKSALLDRKIDAFQQYAATDPVSFCQSRQACLGLPMFGQSLRRQYLLTEADLSKPLY